MDDPKDRLTLASLLWRFLQLVVLAITALISATAKDFHAFLEAVALKLPPLLLLAISGLLFLLLTVIASYLGYLLLITRRENQRLAQKAHFYAIFGAKWKYWPASKMFEEFPHCRCCAEPNPCQIFRMDKNKPESLSCPSKQGSQRLDFCLQDIQGNELTIAEAVKRLAKMEAPHG